MRPDPVVFDATTRPRPVRTGTMLVASVLLHGLLGLMLWFDVAGIGGGFGLGVGPGFGIGSGGGVGLGEKKRREIFSLEDIPELVRPQEQRNDEEIKDLVVARTPQAITVPQPVKPKAVTASKTGPVVQFARPVKPIGAGSDLGARFARAGKGTGGFGLGGGGGGLGISLGTAFGKYVGTLRKGGLDVAIVVDASGSMQNIIDDLKRRLGDMVANMQRLVPSARIGAVVYRDKADDKIATAPRQSEDFVVKWSDLTLNTKKVQSFLGGIVAEGGGDWKEAVKDGLQAAMTQLKWRPEAKKVIILIGSSPPHDEDVGAIRSMIASWTAQNGIVSTVDVSRQLHEEHERKLNKWLYGDEPREMTPLPEFYAEVRASFNDMARSGGGTSIALSQPQGLMRHILVLAFGPQWEKDVSRVARGRSLNHRGASVMDPTTVAPAAMEQAPNLDFVALIQQGALSTYPLIICSIIVLGIVLERLFSLRGIISSTAKLTANVVPVLARGDVKGAIETVRTHRACPARRVFEDLIDEPTVPMPELERVATERTFEEVQGAGSNLWVLGTIGSSAPFIGLFGTVLGIIRAFHAIALAGTGGFGVVASGISEALIATALGLGVGIIAVVFYNYFQARVDRIDAALRIGSGRVLEAVAASRRGNGIQ